MAAKKGESVVLEAGGREVRSATRERSFFPEPGVTKLELVNYYLECEEAVVRGLVERPTVLKRWVDGVTRRGFFQKRVPENAPEWIQTATVPFPSGRTAQEFVGMDQAHLVLGVNLG